MTPEAQMRAPATPIHKAGKPVTSTITLTMGQDDAPETEWTWAPDGRRLVAVFLTDSKAHPIPK